MDEDRSARPPPESCGTPGRAHGRALPGREVALRSNGGDPTAPHRGRRLRCLRHEGSQSDEIRMRRVPLAVGRSDREDAEPSPSLWGEGALGVVTMEAPFSAICIAEPAPGIGERAEAEIPGTTTSTRRARAAPRPRYRSDRADEGGGMETLGAINSRRDVREFADRAIPDEHLEAVLEAGRRAPSSRNGQPWDFVVVTDRERLVELARVWRAAGHVAGSAATVALVAPLLEDAWSRDILHFDLGQAAMSMMLAAADLGIGSGHAVVEDERLACAAPRLPRGPLLRLPDPARLPGRTAALPAPPAEPASARGRRSPRPLVAGRRRLRPRAGSRPAAPWAPARACRAARGRTCRSRRRRWSGRRTASRPRTRPRRRR